MYCVVLPPSGLTTKKPVPLIAQSVFLFVFVIDPSEKICVVELMVVPRPTLVPFLPPSVPCGPVGTWLT